MRHVAAGFHHCQPTKAFRRSTQRPLPRNEECELQLVLGVKSVKPRENLLRRRQRLRCNVVQGLGKFVCCYTIDWGLVEHFVSSIGRIGEGGRLD